MTTISAAAPSTAGPSADTTARSAVDLVARAVGITATGFIGAAFGFFFAWVCSTMWGLDSADPRVAIEAMQAMNASVRNPVFFPVFFLTPVVLAAAAVAARAAGKPAAMRAFAAAAVVYALGGIALTAGVNVPMNEELATVVVPSSVEEARTIWDDYSGTWQTWNQIRTVFSGLALALAGLGLTRLGD